MIAAAERKDERVELRGVVLERFGAILHELSELVALTLRIERGQAVCLFIPGNFGGNGHALIKKRRQIRVNCVYFFSVVGQLHGFLPLFPAR